MDEEKERLKLCKGNNGWKNWGPYLSERQWGTVREDYTKEGNAWGAVTHDQARSKAYRWGEEGIGGICDREQKLCFAWAFWNGKDTILKERIFGLTGPEGNHGEDVKEIYFYLDSSPTHSYMKMLYKYPQSEFPYSELVEKNAQKSKLEPEYELMDTGIFDNDEYFDIELEYAKKDTEDILIRATIHNRSAKAAKIWVLPSLWFRNTWSSGKDKIKPKIFLVTDQQARSDHYDLGEMNLYFRQRTDKLLFCDNETNRKKLYGVEDRREWFKDGINDYVINKKKTINPDQRGTKMAGLFQLKIAAQSSKVVECRLTKSQDSLPFDDFDQIFQLRKQECDAFYKPMQEHIGDIDMRRVQRQAYAGMLWSKQFYYYNVREWLNGDPGKLPPPHARKFGRNSHWQHLRNADIVSMPDKWEYPWYAAWDLAFHCIPFARIDPAFAKEQLLLLLREYYMHPNGQIPAYEWNFNDVNPPVHAWAVIRVFQIDRKQNNGKGDYEFLEKAFHKLLLNFTWWVNQKDAEGNNVFEGGFLGLDNIGVFDRSSPLLEGAKIEQADATSWMAMFALNMLRISLDLAIENPVYQDTATKFFEHFLYIAGAMNNVSEANVQLWDEEDNFYYDVLHLPGQPIKKMKVRSMVGLTTLFAVETLKVEAYQQLPEFRERLEFFLKERPKLASLVSRWHEPGEGERRLLALLRGFRMKKILERMLDPEEFLSPYGIRALSKYHKKHPFKFQFNDETFEVAYLPGESDSSFFGGNSNWRGPIWFPVNYMIIESLLKFDYYYSDDFKIEYPSGSRNYITIKALAVELMDRLIDIFRKDKEGNRPYNGDCEKFQKDPHFKDHILFYEYFNGDNGKGLGASHQTGWTGLIADLIHKFYKTKAGNGIKEDG